MEAEISTAYGNPTITITQPNGTPLSFTVDIACSGIYSLIGFLIFAVFIDLGLTFWGALLLYIPSKCMCASCLELKFKCARSSVGIFICPATKMYYT